MIDILIAHYKEPWGQLKRQLDSIAQQKIDFSQIRVFVLNDGNEVVFDNHLFKEYPFIVDYEIAPRSGTSKIRNLLLKKATAAYIWYLDPDDYLLDGGLAKVLSELRDPVDVLLCGHTVQAGVNDTKTCITSWTTYSLVSDNVLRREFIIDNKLYSDEAAYLAGDMVLETMPKWYARRRRRLKEAVYHYSYEPTSVTRCKTNSWWYEAPRTIGRMIDRLISDGKTWQAYFEFKRYVFTYNSKFIHDAFCETFKSLGLYDLNYKLDLR